MLTVLKSLIPDRFVVVLLATVVFASILPVQGEYANVASTISSCAIFLLFFLHGLRLPRAEVITAIRNWRLQLAVMFFVFAVMPLVAYMIAPLTISWLPSGVVIGIMFLGLLPSTVQSAISYASIAGGNVAASVMASALTNLSAIIITPLLVVLVIGAAGGDALSLNVAIKIITILLLPFTLGQIMGRWLGPWAIRQKALLSFMDRGAIAIAVYVAFSSAVVAGLWQVLDLKHLLGLIGLVTVLLVFAFGGSWTLAKLCGFNRADSISLIFAGAHKSIATGAPLAAILFAGPEAGMVILPALIYHQLQLIVSAPLANRLAAGHKAEMVTETGTRSRL